MEERFGKKKDSIFLQTRFHFFFLVGVQNGNDESSFSSLPKKYLCLFADGQIHRGVIDPIKILHSFSKKNPQTLEDTHVNDF